MRDRRAGYALADVHALQILKYVSLTSNQNYTIYELNLVQKTGERLRVAEYRDPAKCRREASTLAEFLGTPLWDATQ